MRSKIKSTILLLAIALPMLLSANPVSPEIATEIALNFYRQMDSESWPGKAYVVSGIEIGKRNGFPCTYIISLNNEGFVIVAADDRVRPLLGISRRGAYQATENPAFASLLDSYQQQIEYAVRNHLQPKLEISDAWKKWRLQPDYHLLSADLAPCPPPPTVTPLLTTTWNQGCHYNTDCPTDGGGPCSRVYTGCGATAMAQIMKYRSWPSSGFGSYSYTPSGYPLQSANFAASTYNWAAMPNSISSPNTEIAQLMSHCGISVDMQYGSSVSNSFFGDISQALKQYFRYTLFMRGYNKLFLSDVAWANTMRTELDAGHPLFFKGGSHFWVVDGYQTSPDLFHMNWGWGGIYDGYYALNDLTPGPLTFTNQNFTANIVAAAPFEVAPDSLSYSETGGSSSIEISSDSIWSASTSTPWLSLDIVAGNEGYFIINATATANPTYSRRFGYIALARGSYQDTVWADQDGITPILGASPATITEGSGGGVHAINVNCDSNWVMTYADSWLLPSLLSGAGDAAGTVTILSNPLAGSRNGIVAFARGSLRDTIFVDQGGTGAFWCVPIIPTPASVGATDVSINTLNRVSGISEGYVMATDSTRLALDSTYTINVTFSGAVAPAIWIDWNKDGDFFDASEAVVAPAGSWYPTFGGSRSVSVTVPSGAVTGMTRMRVYVKAFPGPTSSPCDSLNVGDIEDFDVYIYDASTPMALHDIHLDAAFENDQLDLNWSLESGLDPVSFTLEGNIHGKWSALGNLPGYQREESRFSKDPLSACRIIARLPDGEMLTSNIVEFTALTEVNFQIGPNPVLQGHPISIQVASGTTNFSLEVLDAMGRLLLHRSINTDSEFHLQTHDMAAGIYWIRIKDGMRVTTKRILIN